MALTYKGRSEITEWSFICTPFREDERKLNYLDNMPFRSYVMDLSTESVPGTYFAHKHIWLLSKNLVTILLICKTWIIPSLDIILKHNHKFI